MVKIEYTLKKVVEPIISGSMLVSDRGAFGVKLVYEVKYYHVMKIGNLKLASPFEYRTETKIYLRPTKDAWFKNQIHTLKDRGRLHRHEYGKSTHPLLGEFWWEIIDDYGYDKPPKLKKDGQVKDHQFIKRLKAATYTDKFRIKSLNFNPKKFSFYK